jgi:glycine oxidase
VGAAGAERAGTLGCVSRAFDVVVVGAGVIGSGIAYECAARGATVALLDRDEPGCQASGAAAGMLAPCSEAHEPGPFLDLAREGLGLWPTLAERLREDSGIDPELSLDGLLRVALDVEAAAEVQERLRWQDAAGIAAGRWVDVADAREIEPALTADLSGAAWYSGEGHVHSPHAVRALVEAARRKGAVIRSAADVVGPARGGGILLRNGERIAAHQVVLAAGAWLGALSAAFGARLPVRPVHGQLIALRGLSATPRRVIYAGSRGYVVAKRDGTVLAGATEADLDFDSAPHELATASLREQAERLLPAAASATEVATWAGLRPCAPDRLPLLGILPQTTASNPATLHVAGAHYRNGVLLAPVTAQGMASMLLDGVTPPGWAHFDPTRLG